MVSKSQMKEIKGFVRKKVEGLDYNHDLGHVERTARLAELLAKREGADRDVCLVAAVHDLDVPGIDVLAVDPG